MRHKPIVHAVLVVCYTLFVHSRTTKSKSHPVCHLPCGLILLLMTASRTTKPQGLLSHLFEVRFFHLESVLVPPSRIPVQQTVLVVFYMKLSPFAYHLVQSPLFLTSQVVFFRIHLPVLVPRNKHFLRAIFVGCFIHLLPIKVIILQHSVSAL